MHRVNVRWLIIYYCTSFRSLVLKLSELVLLSLMIRDFQLNLWNSKNWFNPTSFAIYFTIFHIIDYLHNWTVFLFFFFLANADPKTFQFQHKIVLPVRVGFQTLHRIHLNLYLDVLLNVRNYLKFINHIVTVKDANNHSSNLFLSYN